MLGTLSKVFGGRGACAPREESGRKLPKEDDNTPASAKPPLDPASPEWLAYYAQVAPPEISKWVNPADGSGTISYERLVENLNSLSIPAVPMHAFAPGTSELSPDISRGVSNASSPYLRQATLKQPRGGSGVRSSSESRSELPRSRQASRAIPEVPGTASGSSRQRSTSLLTGPAMSRLPPRMPIGQESAAPSETPLKVPVTATTRQYIGPVPEIKGPISGVSCGELSRPGEHSQVPPDYVEIVNTRRTEMYGVSPQEALIATQHTTAQSAPAGVHAPVVRTYPDAITRHPVQGSRLVSQTNFHKPPPIFLAPVTGKASEEATSKPPLQNADAVEPPPRKGVLYKLGQYVWSEEEIVLGTRDKPDPPLDPVVRQLCSGALFPEVKADPPPQEEPPKE
ncbi:histone lysine set, partial [Cystoisospora suis]